MKHILLATAALIGMSSVTFAADMPVKARPMVPVIAPVFSWTGCYIGGNIGGARLENSLSTFVDPSPTNNINAAARTAITNAGSADVDENGLTGGVQAGCNWQPVGSSFVLGIEGDLNFLRLDATRDTGNIIEAVSGRTVRSIDDIGMDWFSTVRGRVGFAFDRVLIYGTGGVAFANLDISKNFAWDFTDGCPIVNVLQVCHVGGISDTRVGWTAGGGIEWAFDMNWSVKAEYLFADFGDVTHRTFNRGTIFLPPAAQQWADHTVDSTLQLVRFGVNYRFGGGAPVVARY